MTEDYLRTKNNEVRVSIRAVPSSSKTCFAGVSGNALRVKIAAAPEDGKANDALTAFIAASLGCAKRDVRLVSGEKSRQKIVAFPSSYKEVFENISNI